MSFFRIKNTCILHSRIANPRERRRRTEGMGAVGTGERRKRVVGNGTLGGVRPCPGLRGVVRSASAYFAESTRVLAAEYNSELRKAFGRLQDDNRSLYVGNDFKSLRATYAIGHVLAPDRRHPLFRNLPVRRPWKRGCFSVPGRRRTGFVSLSSSFPLRVISL